MKILRFFVFSLLLGFACTVFADNSRWTLHLSYNGEPQAVQSADKFIYVQVNNCLYSYSRSDHSIYTYSTANVLSDISVRYIAWAKSPKKLAVIYDNGNIDLIGNNGEDCQNIPDYYIYTTTDDKTINHVCVKGGLMLLATNFGVVKVNLKSAEIMETYRLGKKFQKSGIDDKYVYALTADATTLYKGDRTKNLIDPTQWTTEKWSGQVSFKSETDDINPEDTAIVKTLKMDDAPRNNQITQLAFSDGRLIVAAGGWEEGVSNWNTYKETAISEYNPKTGWTHYAQPVSAATVRFLRPVRQIAVNPTNTKNIVVGTWGNGLFEYNNLQFVSNQTESNNPHVKSAIEGSASYVVACGVTFAGDGSMYYLTSLTKEALCKRDVKSGEYSHLRQDLLLRNGANGELTQMFVDSRGLVWFVNDNYMSPALYCYDIQSNRLVEYNTFVNQSGTSVGSVYHVRCTVEDKEGNIWIGTDLGPLYLKPSMMSNPTGGFWQEKVPRKDGSSYADYLLSGIDISAIAIDGAGRKWFGTTSNGVYLISADNMTQIEHFTKENSLLLDDEIKDIEINPETGEVFFATMGKVFFATPKGLCSYMSGITTPPDEMTSDNVWAYPNPVTPDYTGEITVTGLTLGASVTITTAAGRLVASGTSADGTFRWNGCSADGERVQSGVYMVHTATSEGDSGVVCKIAVIN
ncbi:MAG: Por secretion system protein [Bacteroidaceae bacterium]|nr:Por secretion system protein [Bacteroidaceae bacterium]